MGPGDADDDCIRNASFCVRFPPIAAATGDASGGEQGLPAGEGLLNFWRIFGG